MSDKKRKTFTLEFKLNAVEYAHQTSITKAADHFGVNLSQISRWKSQEESMKKKGKKESKVVKRNRSIQWPELEALLKTWIINRRKQGFVVSGSSILREARGQAVRMKLDSFKGSSFWIHSFMKRNKLSIRAVSSVGQKLPEDWVEKKDAFVKYVTQIKDNYALTQIGNMDEVPVTFDMPSKFTVEQKGSSDVRVTTSGAEKNRFTVVLCVTANGDKLPAYVIFRRKTVPSGNFPSNIIVSANEKSQMTSLETQLWHQRVWMKRRMAFFIRKSLLMLDSAPGHRTDEVKSKFFESGTMMAMIPGGLTKILQVLDMTVNKSFKAHLRRRWEEWMVHGYKEYTKSGNLKRASYEEICRWISESWQDVPVSAIKNGFKKTSINFYGENNEPDNDVDEEEMIDISEDKHSEDQAVRDKLVDIFLDDENFASDEDDE